MIRKLVNRIIDNATFLNGLTIKSTSTDTFEQMTYSTTVTVANGATTGKEAAIGLPANFRPTHVAVTVTTAATNAVNLIDIGDDADTDSFVDGITAAANSTGYKGVFACNGVRGNTGLTADLQTPDEIEVVVSGDPGATGATFRLTFYGLVFTQ